jgi:hypothetical protein
MTTDAGRGRRARHVTLQALAVVGLALAVWAAPRTALATEASSVRVLDSFDDVTPWTAVASDGVQASVHPVEGVRGRGLRLDFDLAGTAGYALAQRALLLDLPPHYEITFYLRADAPDNNFQVKLVDASGDNVWWVNRPDFQFPREWRLVRIKKRHIEFAWGPTKDRTLRRAATIEFAVAAGRGGGRGSVHVSHLVLRELPDAPAVVSLPAVWASSALPGADASQALDGSVVTAWKSDPAAGAAQTLTIDFHRPREFGGLAVRWLARAHATRYDVQFSDDGVRWQTVRRVAGGRGGPDAVWLPEAETRFLRLAFHDGPGRAYGLAELEVKELAFGASANAFFQALAREAPRAVGVDSRGHRRRQGERSALGGRCARGVEGRVLDRALRRDRFAGRRLGRRRDTPVPGRWLPADPRGHLAPRPVAAAGVGLRVGLTGRVSNRRPLRAPESYRPAPVAAARPGGAAVPGQPSLPVPQHGRRRECHP